MLTIKEMSEGMHQTATKSNKSQWNPIKND